MGIEKSNREKAVEIMKVLGIKESQTGSSAIKVRRTIEDGNIVAVHTEYDIFEPMAGFDIFKFNNGEIIEYFISVQLKIEETINGRTMLDGITEIEDISKTPENKKMIKKFVKDILMERKFDKLNEYLFEDNLIQHSPYFSDGAKAYKDGIEQMDLLGYKIEYSDLKLLIGEGNFVLAVSNGYFANKPFVFNNLFRIKENKIVEHWDVMHEVEPEEFWKNRTGKFV